MTLRQYLSHAQLNARQFAEELGVAQSTITRILNGQRSAGLELAFKIEKITNGKVTAASFLPENTQ